VAFSDQHHWHSQLALFFLTQDRRLSMVMVGMWTIVHAAAFAVQVLIMVTVLRRKERTEGSKSHTNV